MAAEIPMRERSTELNVYAYHLALKTYGPFLQACAEAWDDDNDDDVDLCASPAKGDRVEHHGELTLSPQPSPAQAVLWTMAASKAHQRALIWFDYDFRYDVDVLEHDAPEVIGILMSFLRGEVEKLETRFYDLLYRIFRPDYPLWPFSRAWMRLKSAFAAKYCIMWSHEIKYCKAMVHEILAQDAQTISKSALSIR